MQQKRRITEQLMEYWQDLKGSRQFPDERDIVPEDIEDIWDDCFLVQIREDISGEKIYRYDYLGKNLMEAFGHDILEEEVSDILSTTKQRVIDKLDEVVETYAPTTDESEFVNPSNVTVRYRKIFLPLGRERDKVDFILGGARWKDF